MYSRELSLQNQFLLWAIYIRPYYLYLSPVIKIQTATLQRNFHTSWRMSLKQFIGLPPGAPNAVLSALFEDSLTTTDVLNDKNLQKVNMRFGTSYPTQSLQLSHLKILRCVPNNFTKLFNFAKHTCSCHNQHLTIDAILQHNNTTLPDFLEKLLYNANYTHQ
jgi:hypothetical protein